ncbi:MAG: aminopeptidase P family protein [Acidobacteria bacterium]|nr:aminopeptidase P family protein [Acidobacteriota bacterium]
MNEQLIEAIQKSLSNSRIPGWLFYGFHDLDPIALRILRFPPETHLSRRWFYLVPAQGRPSKLVHRIEPAALDHLPGDREIYLRWSELRQKLSSILEGLSSVAMQYSEKNAIPYVSRVDAGTVELVHSLGPRVVSSADLIQHFECAWTPGQVNQHHLVAQGLTEIVQEAFSFVFSRIQLQGETDEAAVQDFILKRFQQKQWITDSPPIVAVNGNSANPHYQPEPGRSARIGRGDFVLIDLWAKQAQADSVYADITWTGFTGERVPEKVQKVFELVKKARDRGVEFLVERFSRNLPPCGWEVDEQVRSVIQQGGFAEHFVHRTGHNLGREVHGNGVNFDNLETHDTRLVIPGIACTIEPGVYLAREFGVRSEINVLLTSSGPEITTPPQDSVLVF